MGWWRQVNTLTEEMAMTIAERHGPVILTVAIVGGGLTGAAVALHLRNSWRLDPDTLDLVVYEPRAEIGRGLAYDMQDKVHRVNVPAGRMSIDPEDEGAFERWFHATGEVRADPGALAEDGRYYPRRDAFGRYVHAELLSLPDLVWPVATTRGRSISGAHRCRAFTWPAPLRGEPLAS